MPSRADPPPPRSALLLGYAGLLPPAGVLALIWWLGAAAPAAEIAGLIGLTYGALILSFLGGLWWGAAAARLTDSEMAPMLGLSVLPSLIGLAALMLAAVSARWTGGVLALALLAALGVDRRLVRISAMPGWWMRLRVPLSVGLAAGMLAIGWCTT